MFSQNDGEKKLDWMYKSANSLVDREDYLLGRSVDKSLEQLNIEEKQKQLGANAPPKNHVEHECIPPSIRDYKLQQELVEQVDLQAKLQEDPLLTIKKREEETRRQFLQNPVQLKKLQKALSKQGKKCKKKRKENDLDEQLLEKLKFLQQRGGGDSDEELRGVDKKAKKEKDLDIILMHKFNALKSKLTEGDLKDIMDGKFTDTDDSNSSQSDHKTAKSKEKSVREGRDKRQKKIKKHKKKRCSSSSSSESSDESSSSMDRKRQRRKKKTKRKKQASSTESSSESSSSDEDDDRNRKKRKESKRRKRSESENCSDDNRNKKRHKKKTGQKRNKKDDKEKDYLTKHKRSKSDANEKQSRKDDHDAKYRKRSRSPHKNNSTTRMPKRSNSSERSNNHSKRLGPERPPAHFIHSRKNSDDSDEGTRPKIQNWGLVKSDGSQIPLSRRSRSRERHKSKKTVESSKIDSKPDNKRRTTRLTSEEKERKLKEMIDNAAKHDKDRARNIRRYREEDAKEEKQRDFKEDFARKEFIKSANTATVESRIRANLNNIQRSKSDMNSHFSRRH